MALIYGMSEATKEFLKKLPNEVESLDDIDGQILQNVIFMMLFITELINCIKQQLSI